MARLFLSIMEGADPASARPILATEDRALIVAVAGDISVRLEAQGQDDNVSNLSVSRAPLGQARANLAVVDARLDAVRDCLDRDANLVPEWGRAAVVQARAEVGILRDQCRELSRWLSNTAKVLGDCGDLVEHDSEVAGR
jgi:hypothetical protein